MRWNLSNLKEDLNFVASNVDPAVAEKAAKKGLNHVGFGKFEDPATGQITHVAQNGKLIPYNKAIRSNEYQNIEHADDFGNYEQLYSQNIAMVHDALNKHYSPEKFSPEEIDSIQHFTNLGYSDINNRLGNLPTGIPANKMEMQAPDDLGPKHISNLDSITKKHRLPFDIYSYTSLSADHDLMNYQPGKSVRLKTFRNTTIAPENVLNIPSNRTSLSGRPQTAILQILAKKNSRGVYAHNFSSNPKGDFILPRGAKLDIVSGPHKIVGSNAAKGSPNDEVVFFNAVHKS